MVIQRIAILSALLFAANACSNGASFSAGNKSESTTLGSAPEIKPSSTPHSSAEKPAAPASSEAQVPKPKTAETCANRLAEGIVAPDGRHYKLAGKLSACDGFTACKKMATGARVIWQGLKLPDALVACGRDLEYWYQHSEDEFSKSCQGLSLDIPVGGGTKADSAETFDVVCTY